MIGRVEWDWRIEGLDEPVRVAMMLGDDAVFRSEQMPNYAAALTADLAGRPGRVEGYRDALFLRELAARHGGVATLAPPKPTPPGAIH
jgi:hypothetical protein